MPRAFVKEIEKLAKEKNQNQAFYDALLYGIPPTVASIIMSHPIEHRLYGANPSGWIGSAKKRYFPHLGLRLIKGTLAGGTALAGAKYLETRRNKKKKS